MFAEERKMNRMLVKDFLQFDNDKEERMRGDKIFFFFIEHFRSRALCRVTFLLFCHFVLLCMSRKGKGN
jgi:hypothetical protein